MRERDIEKYLVERVKALGGEVRKVKWIGRNGAPDRLVMLPRPPFDGRRFIEQGPAIRVRTPFPLGPRTIWIELKRPGKLATFPADAHERKQHREHERMRAMGQRVVVIDSFEGVDEVLG